MTSTGNTVRFHRVLRAPAERVYRAFLDPDAMVKWLPPYGFTGKVHEITQENIPAVIPVEFCTLGWQESLAMLAHVVEPDIPDGA